MKKVFGILLIVIGSFLSLAGLFGNVPNIIALSNSNGDAEATGAIFGAILAFLLVMAMAIFLIIMGAKLAKSSKQKRNFPTEDY